jgi:hypothetical protein
MISHRPEWHANGRLCWCCCACGWQSGAYRCDPELRRSYTAHLTRLLHTGGTL